MLVRLCKQQEGVGCVINTRAGVFWSPQRLTVNTALPYSEQLLLTHQGLIRDSSHPNRQGGGYGR